MVPLTVQSASHDQKRHVTPCFNCLQLMKEMLPLMMQLASQHSKVGTHGII